MNCPSRTEEPDDAGYNQQPTALSADLTTREDLNGIANARMLRRIASSEVEDVVARNPDSDDVDLKRDTKVMASEALSSTRTKASHVDTSESAMPETFGMDVPGGFGVGAGGVGAGGVGAGGGRGRGRGRGRKGFAVSMKSFKSLRECMMTFGKFVGPGFMVCNPRNLPSIRTKLMEHSDKRRLYRSW